METHSITPFATDTGRPRTYGGLGCSTCWLSAGRVACSVVDHGGIERLKFFGDQALHRQGLFAAPFRSSYPRIFRAQLLVEDRVYTLGIGDGALHPSGWTGVLALEEEAMVVEVSLVCRNHSLIQSVRTLENPKRKKIGLRLMLRNQTRVQFADRTWSPWQAEKGFATCSVVDEGRPGAGMDSIAVDEQRQSVRIRYADEAEPRTTWIGVVGDRKVVMRTWLSDLTGFIMEPANCAQVGLAVVFGGKREAFQSECQRLARRTSKLAWATVAEWQKQEKTAPRPEGLPEVVESFARQAPALIRAVMPDDLPGAMRANFDGYWVWGWDSLFQAHVPLLAGLENSVPDMLDLFARTANPEWGIAHAFDPRMRLYLSQMPSVQGLFAIAAWHHWAVTGDLGLARRHWSFLVQWLDKAKNQARREGLAIGTSLFPDHPQCAGQTGRDLGAMDNATVYQALRALEQLADALGDTATAGASAAISDACRAGFRKHLWDEAEGFWYDSVDADTLLPRPSHPSLAIFWSSPFARELVHDHCRAASFMERNLRCPGGLRMYPRTDPAFNADGNQLGQHYPPAGDSTYMRLMAETGRQDRLQEWLGWTETAWRMLTVPEGCTLEAENDGPHRPDNPGGKQLFSVKTWYDVLLGAILGIAVDNGGLTAEPGLDGPLQWSGLPFHDRRWCVVVKGSGRHVKSVTVGGKKWTGTCKVPLPRKGESVITISRTSTAPRHPILLSADGATIISSAALRQRLSIRITSTSRVLLRFWCPLEPSITINGSIALSSWLCSDNVAEVWLPKTPGDVDVLVGKR